MSVLASIGLARGDPFDPTPTIDALLMRADLAMYVVKHRGGAGVLLHTAELKLEEVDDVALGRALTQALAHHDVTVSFQPIVNLSTGRLDALEALARWAPGGRPMSPEALGRLAGSCNLIDSLFRCVLEEACTRVAQWTALPGGSDIRVAVNITPGQLASPELPPLIAAELARHGLTGERPRDHRDGTTRRHRNQPRGLRGAASPWGTALGRRLRRRAELAGPPQRPPDRRGQDRPLFRRQPGPRRCPPSLRLGRRRASRTNRLHRGRRRSRTRSRARGTHQARLPPGPRLPVLSTHPCRHR